MAKISLLSYSGRKTIISYIIVAVILLGIGNISKKFNDNLSSVFLVSTKPLFYLLDAPLTFAKYVNEQLTLIGTLKQEKELLSEQNFALRLEIMNFLLLKEENNILRKLLNYEGNSRNKFITSRIFIAQDNFFSRNAVLDKGLESGVKKDQAVIFSGGLVGRVLKVKRSFSHILLLNDLDSRIPVYSSKTRNKAIMFGNHTHLPDLRYLVKNHNIEENEIIYTSGDGLFFPENIPVGITKFAKDKIEVIPFAEFKKVDIVKILSK
jgi:rod shape-determining protein MreC